MEKVDRGERWREFKRGRGAESVQMGAQRRKLQRIVKRLFDFLMHSPKHFSDGADEATNASIAGSVENVAAVTA
jgi:hypothetical protein